MKFDLISVIFRLHGLLTVFRNFLRNVKTLEPKTYITIYITISGRNIKGSIFPTLCHIFSLSLGPYRESLSIFFPVFLSLSFFFFYFLEPFKWQTYSPRQKSLRNLQQTLFFSLLVLSFSLPMMFIAIQSPKRVQNVYEKTQKCPNNFDWDCSLMQSILGILYRVSRCRIFES